MFICCCILEIFVATLDLPAESNATLNFDPAAPGESRILFIATLTKDVNLVFDFYM